MRIRTCTAEVNWVAERFSNSAGGCQGGVCPKYEGICSSARAKRLWCAFTYSLTWFQPSRTSNMFDLHDLNWFLILAVIVCVVWHVT
jgi:hypothetical protein